MTKKIAIIQSNYIPWKGYFDIIASVDEFVIYDGVQYTKNDWRNRNKIKTSKGLQWITIPVYQTSLNQKISETQVSDNKWKARHWNSIKTNYAKTPFFKIYANEFEEFYQKNQSHWLSEINSILLKKINNLLNIKTKITNSSDYQLHGTPTENLILLCKLTGASHYLSGPSAKNYLDETLFSKANIKIEWMEYQGYKEYPQLFPPFEHGVSIIDLLFNVGPSSRSYMKSKES